MQLRGKLAMALASLVLLSGCAPAPRSDVGIQLFMFNWESVANECEQSLGPIGIDWVLVSPPQDHLDDTPWWVHYQPTSYRLNSRLGTEAQFADMVERCNRAGVKVIVDAVINHMAGRSSGVGFSGSEFEKYSYPGLYSETDFHRCELTGNSQIASYQDRDQVQRCDLLGLADLNTSSVSVQTKIVGYLKSLLELGVAGFRIDAAKHISADDLEQIISQLPEATIIFHEVIRGGGEPIKPEEYLATGKLWEFSYAYLMQGSLYAEFIPEIELEIADGFFLPSVSAISFITNHDTERNGKSLAPIDGELFELASLIMLASDYGTPMLYSGFSFQSFDDPPPLSDSGEVLAADCESAIWSCQQRSEIIAKMIDWRIASIEQPVTQSLVTESAAIYLRGERALFAVNVSTEKQTLSIQTNWPTGNYCSYLVSDCVFGQIAVDASGKLTVNLEPLSALALLRD